MATPKEVEALSKKSPRTFLLKGFSVTLKWGWHKWGSQSWQYLFNLRYARECSFVATNSFDLSHVLAAHCSVQSSLLVHPQTLGVATPSLHPFPIRDVPTRPIAFLHGWPLLPSSLASVWRALPPSSHPVWFALLWHGQFELGGSAPNSRGTASGSTPSVAPRECVSWLPRVSLATIILSLSLERHAAFPHPRPQKWTR